VEGQPEERTIASKFRKLCHFFTSRPYLQLQGVLMNVRRFLFSVMLFTLSPIIMQAQVAPATTGGGNFNLALGAGFSAFNTDYAPDYMYGVTAYADLKLIRWFGLEIEGRTIRFDAPGPLAETTVGGGGRFLLPHYGRFQPYAKFLIGIGRIDFPANPLTPQYTHDTFIYYAPGVGVDYKLMQHVYLRGDFEYQRWPGFPPHGLTPYGFTIGANYRF
jgi:opacity protein-like surface antigen